MFLKLTSGSVKDGKSLLKKEPLMPKCLLNASEDIAYHFPDVRKMIPVPKGIEKEADDIYVLVIFVI